MLAGPTVALPTTYLLVAVAARTGPRQRQSGRRGVIHNAAAGLDLPLPGARATFALVPLGIGLGVALALGLMPGSAIALVGAFGACTAGHCLLAGALSRPEERQPVGTSPAAWAALVSLSVLAGVLRFSTLDLRTALAAQAATGPGVLGGPALFSAVDLLGGLVGLMAGAAWVEHLPRMAGSAEAAGIDSALRAGESALVGAAVASQVWGPSVGALLHGPVGVLAGPVARSTLVTLGAVVLVSAFRSRIDSFPRGALLGTLAPVAVVALLAARLA